MKRKVLPVTPGWAAGEAYEYALGVAESLGLGALATVGVMNVESKPAVYALGMVGGAAAIGAAHCGRKAVEYWHLTGELIKAEHDQDSV